MKGVFFDACGGDRSFFRLWLLFVERVFWLRLRAVKGFEIDGVVRGRCWGSFEFVGWIHKDDECSEEPNVKLDVMGDKRDGSFCFFGVFFPRLKCGNEERLSG